MKTNKDPEIRPEIKTAYDSIVQSENLIKILVPKLANFEDDCDCENVSLGYTILIKEDQFYHACLQCGGMMETEPN